MKTPRQEEEPRADHLYAAAGGEPTVHHSADLGASFAAGATLPLGTVVQDFLVMPNGRLWLATWYGGGIGASFSDDQARTITPAKKGLTGFALNASALTAAADGSALYLGTLAGVFELPDPADPQSTWVEVGTLTQRPRRPDVVALAADRAGTAYAGLRHGGIHRR